MKIKNITIAWAITSIIGALLKILHMNTFITNIFLGLAVVLTIWLFIKVIGVLSKSKA